MELCMWQTDQVRCLPLAGQLARWSPDGQKILFQQQLQFGGSRLYMATSDGAKVQELPARPQLYSVYYGAWAPDGQRIAFSADVAEDNQEQQQIFILERDEQIPPNYVICIGNQLVIPVRVT
jgi:Tol biopolymer transport system component